MVRQKSVQTERCPDRRVVRQEWLGRRVVRQKIGQAEDRSGRRVVRQKSGQAEE